MSTGRLIPDKIIEFRLTIPSLQEEGRPEIFAYGFRNPYRFSFDVAEADQQSSPVCRGCGPGNDGRGQPG